MLLLLSTLVSVVSSILDGSLSLSLSLFMILSLSTIQDRCCVVFVYLHVMQSIFGSLFEHAQGLSVDIS